MSSLLLAAITTFAATTPHLSVQAIVEPEAAAPNSDLTITFTVTPARGIHVYAPGSEYQAIAITVGKQPGLVARKVVYPASEMYHFEPLDETVPVYQKPFTLKQVVRVSAAALKGKSALTISGTLDYQACDDRVCFRPNAIPFTFEVKVRR